MAVRGCVVDGCTILIDPAVRSLHGGRGMCSQHYQRWRRYGDPLGGKEPLRRKENLISIDGDVATVVLAHNRAVTLIDAADVDLIRPYSWCATTPRGRSGLQYANNTKMGRMHCLIMGERGIDHIDGNGLNNRRGNLRVATVSQNAANQPVTRGTSRYKGVIAVPRASGMKWQAQIGVGGRTRYIGIYVTEEEAAVAYDEMALHHYGEFARLNGVAL